MSTTTIGHRRHVLSTLNLLTGLAAMVIATSALFAARANDDPAPAWAPTPQAEVSTGDAPDGPLIYGCDRRVGANRC